MKKFLLIILLLNFQQVSSAQNTIYTSINKAIKDAEKVASFDLNCEEL